MEERQPDPGPRLPVEMVELLVIERELLLRQLVAYEAILVRHGRLNRPTVIPKLR